MPVFRRLIRNYLKLINVSTNSKFKKEKLFYFLLFYHFPCDQILWQIQPLHQDIHNTFKISFAKETTKLGEGERACQPKSWKNKFLQGLSTLWRSLHVCCNEY